MAKSKISASYDNSAPFYRKLITVGGSKICKKKCHILFEWPLKPKFLLKFKTHLRMVKKTTIPLFSGLNF